MVAIVIKSLSILTLAGGVLADALFLLFFWTRKKRVSSGIIGFITDTTQKYGILFAWIVATIAMFGSLYLSDIAGLAPCILCWYQRILMYPQVFILGVASLRKKTDVIPYALALSIPGIFLSSFHYWEQITQNPLIPCKTVGYSVSCTEKFFMHFGYITIPMMALTAFVLITLFLLYAKRQKM